MIFLSCYINLFEVISFKRVLIIDFLIIPAKDLLYIYIYLWNITITSVHSRRIFNQDANV